MLVEVRPIEVEKWHKKKGQESFAQPLVIECLYNSLTGKYATGLNEKDRKRLEAITGYDLSDSFDTNTIHPFWSSSTARIKLPHRTTIFNTNRPLDEIKVKVLKASKYVANSMKDYEKGLYPEATHVIFDENEEVAIKASKINKKNTALKLGLKLTLEEKLNIIMILSNRMLKGQSQDFVDVEIDTLIEEKTDRFISLVKQDKKQTYIKGLILEAIHKNILTKEKLAVFYMGDKIANTIEEAVDYFLDPQNQQLKTALLEKLAE